MKLINNTLDFSVPEEAIISIGKFDGLHLGHKYLIEELKKGKDEGLKTVAFTFDVPPQSVSESYKVLSTNDEKVAVFEEAGIDYLIECPFNDTIRTMEPYEFLAFLKEKINYRKIVVGNDFKFGHNRMGNCNDLKRFEMDLDYEAVIVEKVQYEGEDISSTRIRAAVEAGDMELANTLLGYEYFVTGPVLHGNMIGRNIGFPTANQLPVKEKLLPPNGVYVSNVYLKEEVFEGVSNIGCKPTIDGEYPVGVETFIKDFDRDIYGERIKVSLLKMIRPEQKFNGLDALKAQIAIDNQSAEDYRNKKL